MYIVIVERRNGFPQLFVFSFTVTLVPIQTNFGFFCHRSGSIVIIDALRACDHGDDQKLPTTIYMPHATTLLKIVDENAMHELNACGLQQHACVHYGECRPFDRTRKTLVLQHSTSCQNDNKYGSTSN